MRGYDYDRISSLPNLNKTSQNSISPFRLFGSDTQNNENTCIRCCIYVASDGLSVCANKILLVIEHNHSLQVAFIATREK